MRNTTMLLGSALLVAAASGCLPTGTEDLGERLDDALDPAPDYVDEPADEPTEPEGALPR